MKYHLPDRIVRELCSFAQKYAVTKIVLFGSRARGTNTERSDVDIAVYGGDFNSFYWDVKENIHSLLMFDVVQADASISDELKKNRPITEYFDLTCFSERDSAYYLTVGACVDESEYSSMTNAEKELHNKFQSKVITIYDEVMAEIKNKNII